MLRGSKAAPTASDMLPMKTVLHVVGARPNYMKIAPVMDALRPYVGIR